MSRFSNALLCNGDAFVVASAIVENRKSGYINCANALAMMQFSGKLFAKAPNVMFVVFSVVLGCLVRERSGCSMELEFCTCFWTSPSDSFM